jgi:hypothetical protein
MGAHAGRVAGPLLLILLCCACDWFSSKPVIPDGETDGIDAPDGDEDSPEVDGPDGDGTDTDVEPDGAPQHIITGRVLEDVNADGNLDDGAGIGAVEVRILSDGGDGEPTGADDVEIMTRITGTDGGYDFSVADGTYWVVVASKTIRPSEGFNGDYGPTDVWAEQTWGPAGSPCADGMGGSAVRDEPGPCFGGRRGGRPDDPTTIYGAEHAARVTVAGFDAPCVDFGFSFNVVTDTADGEPEPGTNRSIQGSLRQALTNANALFSGNVLRFVPAVDAEASGEGGQWWRIGVATPLPPIEDAGTTLDGTAFSLVDGLSLIDANHGDMGTGGTVGVEGAPLARVARPELEITGIGVIGTGLRVLGGGAVIRHLAVTHFGSAEFDGNLVVESAANVVISGNVIGLPPDVLAPPADEGRSPSNGIVGVGARRATVEGNLIAYCGRSGVLTGEQCGDWVLSGNEVRGNSSDFPEGDGLDLAESAGGFVIEGNLLAENAGSGMDSYGLTGGFAVTGNTIEGNGFGMAETAGVRLFGAGSAVTGNVVTGNAGPGILVVAYEDAADGTPGVQCMLSSNHFGGNGGSAIDLAETSGAGEVGDGITLNSGGPGDFCGYGDGQGNRGLDFPVLTGAELNGTGTTLTVSGTTCRGSTVQVYRAQPGAGDVLWTGFYGEGVEYLGDVPVDDFGSFSGSLGVRLNMGDQVTAIAVDASGNTSEFCENVTLSP